MKNQDFNYNKDFKTRDRLIFNRVGDYSAGGTEYFKDLTPEKLKQLVELKFANPEDEKNCAPSIAEFIERTEKWQEQYPELQITFNGYTVSPEREDYRITVDAVIFQHPTDFEKSWLIELIRFISSFHPDEIKIESDYCYLGWD